MMDKNPLFPYYYLFVDKDDIVTDFKSLSKIKIDRKKGSGLLDVRISRKKLLPLIKITDYFSEKCRLRCKFSNFRTPVEYFENNYKQLEKLDFEDYWAFESHLKSKVRPCSNFPNMIALEVYRYFKPKRILDFSAGWGDRLSGALAYGKAEYTGVDPSECMYPRYKEMINFFTTYCPEITGLKTSYKVIRKPFENYKVKKDHYDLVFTSPPFFDYEVYESSNKNQSIDKWSTLGRWKQNFMFPALEKSMEALQEGGHLALYIEDYKGHKYVKDVMKEMENMGNNKFIGTINWENIDREKRKTRNIYVWSKSG